MGRPPSVYLEDTDCKFPDNDANPDISGSELGCKPSPIYFCILSLNMTFHSPRLEVQVYSCLSTVDTQTCVQPW